MQENEQRKAGIRKGATIAYVVAVGGTVLAALVRWAIGRTVGEIPPFITFYVVVIASATLGGTGPGLVATLLTALAADYFFIAPRGTLLVATMPDVVSFAIFVGINIVISIIGGRLWSAHGRVQEQKAQLERSAEESRLQVTALEAADNAIVITDRNGAIQWANPAFARLTGYSVAEVVGQNPRSLKSAKHEPAFYKQMWNTILAGQVWHGELVNKRKDGTLYNEEMTITPVADTQGATIRFIAVKQDISERKRAEESQARLAAIVEWSEDAIISKGLDGKIQTWNAGAERMFGYRAEEVIGQPVTILLPPERIEEEDRIVERLTHGETIERYETERVTKDGRRLDVLLTISPVKDREGRVIGASKILRDIGDIVRARQVLTRCTEDLERQVTERTAKLREAMAELEGMSYSMVHDLRAPLRAMQTFASLAEEDCAGCSRPQNHDYFHRIRAASLRMDRLITDALNYNKVVRQEFPITPVDVARLVQGMVQTYPNLQAAAAGISIECNELLVLGNESLLTQCFGNLLDNAVKFVAPGVKPRVLVRAESVQSAEAKVQSRATEERAVGHATRNTHHTTDANSALRTPHSALGTVRLWFEDNGIGIPKEAHEKVFGMFQRMHLESEYQGTGIGLAIVRKAVERMGGRVGVESEPGKGSRFWIELAQADEAAATKEIETAA